MWAVFSERAACLRAAATAMRSGPEQQQQDVAAAAAATVVALGAASQLTLCGDVATRTERVQRMLLHHGDGLAAALCAAAAEANSLPAADKAALSRWLAVWAVEAPRGAGNAPAWQLRHLAGPSLAIAGGQNCQCRGGSDLTW